MNKNIFSTMTACVILATSAAAAQAATTGNITGSIKDTDGKPLAGVQVTITGIREITKTGKDGEFIFVGEDPQAYTLQASLAGYKVAASSAVVKPNVTSRLTFTLTNLPLTGGVIRSPENFQPGGTHPVVPDALPYSPGAFTGFSGDAGLHPTARSR